MQRPEERGRRKIRYAAVSEGARGHKHEGKRLGIKIWSIIHPLSGLVGPCIEYEGAIGGKLYRKILDDPLVVDYVRKVKQWRETHKYDYWPHLDTDQIPFVQDGAGGHTGDEFMSAFASRYPHLKMEPHPSNSPDLNPIETCWQMLKRSLRRCATPTTKRQLKDMVLRAWNGSDWYSIDWSVVMNFVRSRYQGNLEATVECGGGNWYPEGRAVAYLQYLPPAVCALTPYACMPCAAGHTTRLPLQLQISDDECEGQGW